ncbi:MAG: peptidoglycan DD-metalloendopeptidase family protein, partial [Gammaproteobacteria bacterium]
VRENDSGSYAHQGADFMSSQGQTVLAVIDGNVTKVGYPYGDDLGFRYVQITGQDGYAVREFYVQPFNNIEVGSYVTAGQGIGTYQSLQDRYPGITDHVHVEVRQDGVLINPVLVIPFP